MPIKRKGSLFEKDFRVMEFLKDRILGLSSKKVVFMMSIL
jgi:hypothetical protein